VVIRTLLGWGERRISVELERREIAMIFMLELEGVLSRDKNKKLPNVFICEKDESVAVRIRELVRPPVDEAIIPGPLERILTFEDDEHTRGRSPNDDVRNRHIRNRLRIKGLAQRLKSYFPFDIINFDAYGNLLNPDDEANKLLYQSFKKIFELQKSIDTFLLFVTTPITHIHPYFQSQFKNDLDLNVSKYPEVHTALLWSVNTIDYDDIDDDKRTALGFAKSIVIPAAKSEGWNSKHKGIYVYQNKDLRKMLSSVIQFSNARIAPDESVYVEDIIRIIEQMPKYYSYEDSLKNQEVKKHLDQIKEYREKTRNEYRK
jgi:hypothetical protein